MPVGWGLEMEMRWSAPKSNGDGSSGRSGHSFTCIKSGENRSKAVLFGGNDFQLPAGPTCDLFEMNLETFEWNKVESVDSGPAPRAEHSATVVGDDKICLFGGLGVKSRLNDCWMLDTATMTWSLAYGQDTKGVPSPRGGHAACVVGTQLFIIFGYGGKGYSRRDLDDICTLDLVDMQWKSISPGITF